MYSGHFYRNWIVICEYLKEVHNTKYNAGEQKRSYIYAMLIVLKLHRYTDTVTAMNCKLRKYMASKE